MSHSKTYTEMVQELVNSGATTVEQIHLAIAGMPFGILERVQGLEQLAKTSREIQQQVIGHVYDTIRGINNEVHRFANELIGDTSTPSK